MGRRCISECYGAKPEWAERPPPWPRAQLRVRRCDDHRRPPGLLTLCEVISCDFEAYPYVQGWPARMKSLNSPICGSRLVSYGRDRVPTVSYLDERSFVEQRHGRPLSLLNRSL
jgi:hypothetical protein